MCVYLATCMHDITKFRNIGYRCSDAFVAVATLRFNCSDTFHHALQATLSLAMHVRTGTRHTSDHQYVSKEQLSVFWNWIRNRSSAYGCAQPDICPESGENVVVFVALDDAKVKHAAMEQFQSALLLVSDKDVVHSGTHP